MTELATRPAGGTVSVIQETALELASAHRIATAIVSTQFAPAHFRGKPDDGAAAIMYGAAIGLDPLAALQNIYVIGGKPALYARTMVAVVMSHGHNIWTEGEPADTAVTVCGQRKGSDKVERITWTVERARKAGYTNNKKYDTDPQAMLYARASGDVARRIAPDALLGMAYTVEELQVQQAVEEPALQAPAARADRLLAAIAPAAPQVAPEPEAQPVTPEPVEGEQGAIWPDVAQPGGA